MDRELNMLNDLEFYIIIACNLTITVYNSEKGKCWHDERELRKTQSNLILKEQLPFHFSDILNNMTIIINFSFTI